MADMTKAVAAEGYENAHMPGVTFQKSPYSNVQHVDDCLGFAPLPGGGIAIASTRDANAVPLTFDAGEVAAFVKGAKAGAFDHLTA